MTELIDTRLGQYQLTEVVGRGGMAVVYKAFQPSLERFVAIKLLLHHHDPQFAERFKREARTIANLQHPNILPIYDYGEQEGMLYLVLQFIENGATLADTLGASMEPAPALRLMARVLEALDYAHRRGIIHRDIKPSNILLLSPRWPMLADFGIAKLMTDDQRLTMSGMIVGTAAYMSPEQAAGRTVDARTDLYAVGIVLYELLTGRVPFEADTPIAVLIKQSYEPPPPPRSLNPALPEAVETALLRALAKDPADRYQSAAEMAEVLERVAAEIERSSARDQRAELYQSGIQAFEARRWETAIDLLSRVVALDPAYADAARRLDEARKEQAAAKEQAMRAGLYQAGLQAFEAKRWETAIDQFDRLVALDPAYADAVRRLDEARKEQATLDQQTLRTELYQAGLQAFEAQHWEAAIDQFDQLVALDPEYKDVSRRLDEARKQQATTKEQALRAGLYQSGVQAFQAGRWETAIGQFSQLLARDPEYEDASRWLENARKAQMYSLQQSARRGADDLTQVGQAMAAKPATPAAEPLSSATPAPRAETRLLGNRQWPLWIGALAAVVLLGGGLLFARGRGGDPPPPTPAPTGAAIAAATAPPAPSATTRALVAGATAAAAASPTSAATATPADTSTPASSPTTAASPTATSAPSATPLPGAVVEAQRVNLRSGPSERFPSLGLYEHGTNFYIVGKTPTGDWLQVLTLDEQVGWVFAANLPLNGDLAQVPVADSPPTPTLQPTPRPQPRPQPQPQPQQPQPQQPQPEPPTAVPQPPTPEPAPPPPTPTQKKDDDKRDKPKKPTPPPR
jgi:tetratricopeptide (TPR) repeat protein/uncharacterized protein YraI